MQFPSFPEHLHKETIQPTEDFSKLISSQWLGLTPYTKALEIQKETWEFVQKTNSTMILGLEHPSVITIGKRSEFQHEIRATEQELKNLQVEWAKTDRGGMATVHSPGQLVIYPIFPLKYFDISVRHFILLMEQTTKEVISEFGVELEKRECNPGLYTRYGKIASFGFRIDQGISRHGISINVSNDLRLFGTIRPCGKDNETFDRIKSYQNVETFEVFKTWLKVFEPNLLDLLNHVR